MQKNIEGRHESESRGSPYLWSVAADYCITSVTQKRKSVRFLQAVGPRHWPEGEEYLPIARQELPQVFAKLADGDEARILDFARRYGRLGYVEQLQGLEYFGAVAMFSHDMDFHGDPVPWISGHAQVVDFLLQLAARLDDARHLRAFLDQHTTARGVEHPTLLRGSSAPGTGFARVFDDAQQTALTIMELTLTEQLSGMRRTVVVDPAPGGGLGLRAFFSFACLLDVIYWLVADAVVGETVRACALCGRPFVATDPRHRYCRPARGSSSVSPCMNVKKQRDCRKRKSAKQARGKRKAPDKPTAYRGLTRA